MNATQLDELSLGLAGEIQRTHQEAQRLAGEGKEKISEAMRAAVECGQHLEDAEGLHRGEMIAWLRDNVPNLHPKQAQAYMSLATTWKERECHAIDSRQLLLLGVLEQREQGEQQRHPNRADQSRWVSWVVKARTWLEEMDRERPVETWSDDEKDAVIPQLEPLAKLYSRLIQ